MENTYKDINKSDKNRSAAAWAIINVDKNRAEILFLPYLHGQKDDTIVVRAIYDLGRNGSVNALPAIEK